MTDRDVSLEFDVFLSYARVDKPAVLAVERALQDAGLRVWRDEPEVEDFVSIQASVCEGLARSKCLLAYYSETYVRRRACQWELTAALIAATRLGADVRQRILVANPYDTWDLVVPVELRDARTPPLPHGEGIGLERWAQSIANHVKHLHGVLSTADTTDVSGWLPVARTSSTRFVGRLEALLELHSELHKADVPMISGVFVPRVIQVRGLAGIGKSLLIEEYGLRFGAAYPGGKFWLTAAPPEIEGEEASTHIAERRRAQMRVIAGHLGISARGMDPDEIDGAVRSKLTGAGSAYLWVVDDVPPGWNSPVLRQWFGPGPLARTIMTTRSHEYDGHAVDLSMLSAREGVELLTARHPRPLAAADEAAAVSIVELLGGHALAIDVAGAALFTRRGRQTFAEFLERLQSPADDVLLLASRLAGQLPNGHESNIAATLASSIALVGSQGRDILRLAAMLDHVPIPTSFIRAVLQRCDKLDEHAAWDALDLGLNQVDSLSLAERVGGPVDSRLVHRLVTWAVKVREDNSARSAALRLAAVDVLEDSLPEAYGGGATGEQEQLFAHAAYVLRVPEDLRQARLLGRVAQHYQEYESFGIATGLRQSQLAFLTGRVPSADREVLAATLGLAYCVGGSGRIAEGMRLAQTVFDLSQRVNGDADSTTIQAAMYVGRLLTLLDKRDEALQIKQWVVNVVTSHASQLGRSALVALDNLAQSLVAAGKPLVARQLQEQIVVSFASVAGDDDLDRLVSRLNLAVTLQQLGDRSRANENVDDALARLARVLGEEHPLTLTAKPIKPPCCTSKANSRPRDSCARKSPACVCKVWASDTPKP